MAPVISLSPSAEIRIGIVNGYLELRIHRDFSGEGARLATATAIVVPVARLGELVDALREAQDAAVRQGGGR